ncbi:glycosyltransferase family 4 protein [Candidatus Entotheonella palauensis]|uniref:glycosyltransferase family 4 protein n=1 Tax=Candidatus Entotheonella palauensis TaxID=93172 RepID=UPI000B7D2D64|nr:glycosyltransferase family 4 protein [Candidatus Entotheonella palauensis]
MRITFVMGCLRCGGAERVVSYMANYWAAKGWPITIITLEHGNQPPCYEQPCYDLHPAVVHHDLGDGVTFLTVLPSSPGTAGALNLAQPPGMATPAVPTAQEILIEEAQGHRALRAAIRRSQPQVVISFIYKTNIRTLLAARGLGIPVIVSERNDPYKEYMESRGWEMLRQQLYPHAAFVVALTAENLRYYAPYVGKRGRVIPNPVLSPPPPAEPQMLRKTGKTLLTMGRLAPAKGIDLLLQAFAPLAVCHPEWSLEIWGEGSYRTTYETLADTLGLTPQVRFPGFTPHPHQVLQQAGLFVMASRYEGFPNALCEAMACGLPVVSFACSSGPRQIIRDGIDGVLVPPEDVPALCAALDRLMGDAAARQRLAQRAPEVCERFHLANIMGMWEQLLRQATQRMPGVQQVPGALSCTALEQHASI